MPKEKILITVKTYPTLSEKYTELACTAGLRPDGTWIRIYPVPFRLLDQERRYKKYQWIEADVSRNSGDSRPESYKVTNADNIKLLDEVGTEREWEERRRIVLANNKVYTSMNEIISLANKNTISLAIFKPTEFLEFVAEPVDPNWSQDKIDAIHDGLKQMNLFEEQNPDDFKIMPKLPYKFYYRFKDSEDKESRLMIEDWEIGQLYWNCLERYGGTEAVNKVKQKYYDDFVLTKDLHLFLGTTRKWHGRAKNPFVIIGTFHPPHQTQPPLF